MRVYFLDDEKSETKPNIENHMVIEDVKIQDVFTPQSSVSRPQQTRITHGKWH